jgi:drug/metabolite transporter (DMT)-like permease
MNKILGIICIIAGIVLAVYGVNATNSFSSDVSRFFTGTPTEKSIWMLIGGIALAVVGLVLSGRRSTVV